MKTKFWQLVGWLFRRSVIVAFWLMGLRAYGQQAPGYVYLGITNATGAPLGRTITFSLMTQGSLASFNPIFMTPTNMTPVAGFVTNTFLAANYLIQIDGIDASFLMQVPTGTNIVNGWNYVPPDQFAPQSLPAIASGTNTLFTTNYINGFPVITINANTPGGNTQFDPYGIATNYANVVSNNLFLTNQLLLQLSNAAYQTEFAAGSGLASSNYTLAVSNLVYGNATNSSISTAQTIANNSSNSLVGVEQTAINTASNSVYGNATNSAIGVAQTIANTTSNSVYGNATNISISTAQTIANTTSNSVYGNATNISISTAQTIANTASNSVYGNATNISISTAQTIANTSSNSVYGNATNAAAIEAQAIANTTSNSVYGNATNISISTAQTIANTTSNSVYGNATNISISTAQTIANTTSNSVYGNATNISISTAQTIANTTSNSVYGNATNISISTAQTIANTTSNSLQSEITSSSGISLTTGTNIAMAISNGVYVTSGANVTNNFVGNSFGNGTNTFLKNPTNSSLWVIGNINSGPVGSPQFSVDTSGDISANGTATLGNSTMSTIYVTLGSQFDQGNIAFSGNQTGTITSLVYRVGSGGTGFIGAGGNITGLTGPNIVGGSITNQISTVGTVSANYLEATNQVFGLATNAFWTTNAVGFYAGDQRLTFGSFYWNMAGGANCLSNPATGAILTNNGATWTAITNGVSINTASSLQGNWSGVGGAAAASSVIIPVQNHNLVWDGGWMSMTNLQLIMATNGTQATNYANTIGLQATNNAEAVGLQATNYANTIGLNATNEANVVGQQGTNYANTIGLNATNEANVVGQQATNYANTIGLQATNNAETVGLQATNYANTIGLNGSNNVTALSNNLALTLWTSNLNINGYTVLRADTNDFYFNAFTGTAALTNIGPWHWQPLQHCYSNAVTQLICSNTAPSGTPSWAWLTNGILNSICTLSGNTPIGTTVSGGAGSGTTQWLPDVGPLYFPGAFGNTNLLTQPTNTPSPGQILAFEGNGNTAAVNPIQVSGAVANLNGDSTNQVLVTPTNSIGLPLVPTLLGVGGAQLVTNEIHFMATEHTNTTFVGIWPATNGWNFNSFSGITFTNSPITNLVNLSGMEAAVSYPILLTNGQNSRFITTFIVPPAGIDNNGLVFGFSTNGGPPSSDAQVVGIYTHNNATWAQFHTASLLGQGYGAGTSSGVATVTNGTYGIAMGSDASNFLWCVMYPGHSNEWNGQLPWNAIGANVVSNFVLDWLSFNPTVGYAGGRVGGAQSILPRTGIEGNFDVVFESVDNHVGAGQSGGDQIRVAIPPQYDSATNIAAGLIVYCHGNGGNQQEDYNLQIGDFPTNNDSIPAYFETLLTNNFLIISFNGDNANGGHQDTWGVSNALACIDAAIGYMRPRYAWSNTFLLGASAGGQAALDYAASGHEKIAGILMNHAVASSSNQWTMNVNRTDMDTAFGGSSQAQLATTLNIGTIAGYSGDSLGIPVNKFYGIPIRCVSSSGDTTVFKTTNTDMFIQSLGGNISVSNAAATLTVTAGGPISPWIEDYEVNGAIGGHGYGCYTPAVAAGDLAFLAKCAQLANANNQDIAGPLNVYGLFSISTNSLPQPAPIPGRIIFWPTNDGSGHIYSISTGSTNRL